TAEKSIVEILGRRPGRVDTIPSIASRLPRALPDAQKLAADHNPRIKRMIALADAATLGQKAAEAGDAPQVSLDLAAGRAGDFTAPGAERTDVSLSLKFEMPVVLGKGSAAQKRQKQFEKQAADLDAQQTSTGVFAGVDAAFARLSLARDAA